MSRKKLSVMFSVRITEQMRSRFRKKAQRYGDPSDIHRELLNAFIEGRVQVVPSPNNQLEKFYNDH